MPSHHTLAALLEADQEPSPALYKVTVDEFLADPEQINYLTETDTQYDVLLQLQTRSERLLRFFRGLRYFLRANSKSMATSHIAAGTATFVVQTLPALHQQLSTTELIDLLNPALELCLSPSQPPPMRKLGSVLADCNSVLEHLATDFSGVPVLRQLACILSTSLLDAPLLETWTERLVRMVGSCKANHDVAQTIQQYGTLRTLKSHLRSLEAKRERKPSGSIVQKNSLPFSSMTKLGKEDKKTQHGREQEIDGPTLDENIRHDLKIFHLPDPKSWAALRNVIESLEGDETSQMLLAILDHFPCKLCIPGLGSAPRNTDASTPADDSMDTEDTKRMSDPQIEILGCNLGVWQILLSEPALKSLRELSSQGLIESVATRLKNLASGSWSDKHTKLTGTEAQTKRLQIPLFATEFQPGEVILWQVDVGTTRDLQIPEQVVKVWGVGSLSKMDKVFDSVTFLQRSYTSEVIRCCCKIPLRQDMKPFPVRFETSDLRSATANKPVTNLDVRTVDQDTIEMANKFYALTEPVFKAIESNDLLAVFPFDLSTEEVRIFSHFKTASMILGRSGTGKTTCLVFKLVGKYLTSKAAVGKQSVKQVLLTRSSFLADRLRGHTRGLIKTLDADSIDAKPPPDSKDTTSMTSQENLGEEIVSTLEDHHFPLVLAFDDFLSILENIAKTLDCKETSISEVYRHEESAKPGYWRDRQLVDFYTFKLDYWPGLPRSLTRRVGVNLVFAEIMGVIKGSASSGKSLTFLSRQDYLNRSCRLAPVFKAEDDRSVVYDIFERYEEMRKENQDVDNVDRVVRMMKAIRRNASLKQLLESTFDEVYIDEVQDQRCVDIQLFLEFIKDSRGLHFAGDTAQAISQDSTFRFSDVKAIIYEHFVPASIRTKQSQLSRTTMFTLSKNYRSHRGILALASLVMKMIWDGFPETVDKLEPEVGNLDGPKPVLFLGCNASILLTSNVGLVNLTDRSADYGAEQVILVRDEAMKTKLQAEIGDIALILTILDSKGMEFDDVILWNFFTSSPDPSGVRSLGPLATGVSSAFDAQRHSGMCSELKHLYVAITRAKIQLFLLESSEKAMGTIVELLTSSPSGPLVDVTKPHEAGFAEKLKMLRPGTSVDPARYSLRGEEFMQLQNFEGAVWCFHRANNDQREDMAKAKMFEAKGRTSLAKKDIEGATQYLEAAIELFLKTNEISHAAENLEKLTRFVDAAELWLQCNQPTKAATLFAKAGLYIQAADCHHVAGNYGVAAVTLRQGERYDEMVSYLCDNRQAIAAHTFRSFSLLCKILLKKNKISSDYRKYAIEILGSSIEQEACFVEYGMDAELAKLYSSQNRHKDLFHLCTRKGELGRALNLAISNNLLQDATDDLESQVLSLLDYVWAGHLEKLRLQHSAAPLKLPPGYLSPNVKLRVEQWNASNLAYSLEGSVARHRAVSMQTTVPKTVFCLRKVFNAVAISKVPHLDDLPLEMMQEAIRFATDLVVKAKGDALSILLLVTGLWRPVIAQNEYHPLPWSPLREDLDSVGADAPNVAKRWFLDILASAVLTMDTAARELWKSKWPTRCVHFLTGFCPRERNHENCRWLHQAVSREDFGEILKDLLRVNSVFCNLATIYYHRAMNGTFQKNYLGLKRYWLERLLREITHLSAVEQDALVIEETLAELCAAQQHTAISSSVEELLYFRLVQEWKKRSDFASLLEQMQQAQAFDPGLQSRFFRTLSCRLHNDNRGLLQSHLGLLNSLKQGLSRQGASAFQTQFNFFLRNLDNIDIRALSTLHAVTAIFEHFGTYLILKTCDAACILTEAWVKLYVPQFAHAITSVEPLELKDIGRIYQDCLIGLLSAFGKVLRRFNEVPQPGITLLCSGNTHHSLLLRQRNSDLVAIVIANLASACSTRIAELWNIAKGVFEYDFVRAYHLKTSDPAEIAPKLASSFSKYNGKDALIVVIKDRKKRSPFSNLEQHYGVSSVLFDQLRPQISTLAPAQVFAEILPTSADSLHEEYTKVETQAASKIQDFWRAYSHKMEHRRLYMQLPEARAIAHFISLGAECPATLSYIGRVAFREVLTSKGVAMSLRLVLARGVLSNSQKDAMACFEKAEISTGLLESVDDVLRRNLQADTLLRKAEERMSDKRISEIVKAGVLSILEEEMGMVEGVLVDAERILTETGEILDAVSRSLT